MSVIVENIFWILIVCGTLNLSTIILLFAPAAAFRASFGETWPNSPGATIVARTAGAMIAAVGVLLILAAFEPQMRLWVLIFASVGKLVFAGSILGQAGRYRGTQAFSAAIVDLLMVALFMTYLVAR